MVAAGEIASKGMAASVRKTFTVAPEVAGDARGLVGDLLIAIGVPGETRGDVLLMLTELITNAMVHGAAGQPGLAIELLLYTDDKVIHVAVTDPGLGGTPELREDLLADGGRGLRLVDALSDRWGHEAAEPAGCSVWFEVDHQYPRKVTP
ncbi:ATP-binding protein [Actinomadura scrupuli]|uniref:ATP-binding protein n=1 Tax=Actinomadura scrupuli TaxID=559629 RepID=UPI003D99951A